VVPWGGPPSRADVLHWGTDRNPAGDLLKTFSGPHPRGHRQRFDRWNPAGDLLKTFSHDAKGRLAGEVAPWGGPPSLADALHWYSFCVGCL
jgi:hypothetical protein